MTTNVDIVNQALQLIGSRTTIAAMNEPSNEAIQANLIYVTVTDWCHHAANWNFARKIIVLTQLKAVAGPVGTWTNASPAPPWLFEYSLPSDFIRAQYITNSAHATTANWDGELQRFAMAMDVIAGVPQPVVLTNATPAILIYTSRVVDPTLWTATFNRFVVSTLAHNLVMALVGSKSLHDDLMKASMMNFQLAEQANREEGTMFSDTTPEWIQALGIEYPHRRSDARQPHPQQRRQQPQQQEQDDNER